MKRRVALAIDLDWPLPHHQGVAGGVLRYAREKGWICELDPYLGGAYDGVVGRATREMAAWVARTKTPAVNVWVNSPDRTLPRVVPDFRAAGAMVAKHLRDRGLRRLAFLGRERDAAARVLLEGFGAVESLFVPTDPRRLQRRLRQWVKSWKPPLGVFVSADLLARYLCDAAMKAGLRIPEDVAIVGAGNTELLNNLMEPTLSSVEYGFERIGRRAAELLAGLMAGRKPPRAPVLLPPAGIVARRSSDMFAVADPLVSAALRAIWSRSGRPVRVAALLQEVPTSRRTLERRFRESLGRTVHDEIRRAHLERAKKMLVEGDEPLKVVASKAGFRDAPQFSRVFRAAEGCTPQGYRKSHAP